MAAETSIQGPRPSWQSELALTAVRTRLFLSSYAPLFAIMAVRFEPTGLRAFCGLLAVGGLLDAVLILRKSRSRSATRVLIPKSVRDVGPEVAGYLASYLLPFVTVTSPSWRDLLAYGLFLLVVLVIYVRSALIRINPTFYLLGFRVFELGFGTQAPKFVIARFEPHVGEPLDVTDAAGVFIHVSR